MLFAVCNHFKLIVVNVFIKANDSIKVHRLSLLFVRVID